MPAPSPPVPGTVAQGTGLSLNPDYPDTVNTDDILVIWYTCMNANNPATAFTWPEGYTEGRAVQLFDELGAHIGLAGWAWKRSTDGSESGGSYTVTRNGGGGTQSSSMSNCMVIPGCETDGDPHNVEVVNNPNPSSDDGDFPAITTTVADSLIVTMLLKSGAPGNYGTPSGWTIVVSNSGTGGQDGSGDVDYRQVATPDTYDPGSVTVAGYDDNTGWATFQIAFIEPQESGTPQHLDAAGNDLELTADASLTVQKPLAAEGDQLELEATAALTVEKLLAADGNLLELDAEGELTVEKHLIAIGDDPELTATGELSVASAEHLDATGDSLELTASAELTVEKILVAEGLITFDGAAALTAEKRLAAIASIPFTATATATVWKHLAAEGASAFTGTARLTVGVALAVKRLRTLLRVGT